jgi:hypothetical protein
VSGKKRILSIVSDPRYLDLIRRYDADWDLACAELLGIETDFQQREVLDNVSKVGSRTSVSSGHGTGKSFLTAAMIIIFMILHPGGRVVIIANKIRQVMDAVWKNLKIHFKALQRRFPWIANYFVLTESSFFERTSKGIWYVSPKGFRLNQEESLAGEHADHMLTIVDEASGVNDRAFGVIMGAQTSEDNRVLLLSQPTRVGGYFYRTHHDLSIKMSADGTWHSITMSSALSKHVTKQFIIDKLKEYGGFDSPEFQIKVLGCFPRNMSAYLLGRDDVQAAATAAARRAVAQKLGADWGWVATIDVGGGRDRSVINISRVSGPIGPERVVVNHRLLEMPADIDPAVFCRRIVAECCSGQYPNITIAIDGDGAGHQVHSHVSELAPDFTVIRIRWGFPPKMPAAKRRFVNLRAMAHIYTQAAILTGRMGLDSDNKTIDQFSKLPVSMNESGLWLMMKKEIMRTKLQIPSPDRSDTYCFTQLIDYVPHNYESDHADHDTAADEMADWLDS